jgi:hypothetical protein
MKATVKKSRRHICIFSAFGECGHLKWPHFSRDNMTTATTL